MKKLLLILFFLLFAGISYSQDKPFNTVFTVGHSFQDDISFSIGGRASADRDLFITYDHMHSFATKHQANYIGIGLGNHKQIILFKYGVTTEPYEDSHIHFNDYGAELLWIFENLSKRELCYGLAVTKRTGIGIKIGLVF